MKTAEEWLKEFEYGSREDRTDFQVIDADDIKAIQADAVRTCQAIMRNCAGHPVDAYMKMAELLKPEGGDA